MPTKNYFDKSSSGVEGLAASSGLRTVTRRLVGAQVVVLGGTVISNKVAAVSLGVESYGFFALYIAAANLIASFLSFGLPQVITNEIAAAGASESGNGTDSAGLVTFAFHWSLFALIVVLPLIYFGVRHTPLSPINVNKGAPDLFLVYFAAYAYFISLMCIAILAGFNQQLPIRNARIFGAIVSAGFVTGVLCLTNSPGLPMVVLGMGASVAIFPVLALRNVLSLGLFRLKNLEARTLQRLLTGGFWLMLVSVLSLGSLFLVRVIIGEDFGPQELGLYSAAFAVSNLLPSVMQPVMATGYTPLLSTAIAKGLPVRPLIYKQMWLNAIYCLPVSIAGFLAAPVIITLLFSESFASSSGLLRLFLFWAHIRVIVWPVSYFLIVKREYFRLGICEALAVATLLMGSSAAVDHGSIEIVGWVAIASTIMAGLCYWRVALPYLKKEPFVASP